MKAALHITSGPLAGRRLQVRPGEPLRVGRSARVSVEIGSDERLAAVHFELSWDGKECRVRDVSKQGTALDGQKVEEAVVRDGGFIVAGETRFLVRIVPDDLSAGLPPPPAKWRPPTKAALEARAKALEVLRGEEGLYAILDAARDRRIKTLVDSCEEENQSLFDGEKGDVLAEVAPYLVRFERGSALLSFVVSEGWGDSWGVYLTSSRPLNDVRKRLRRSLMVTDEETKKRLYFRFYDPRVLRLFLPESTARQKSEMMGTEIKSFLMEGEEDRVLRLVAAG
jgi:hypothetical protein